MDELMDDMVDLDDGDGLAYIATDDVDAFIAAFPARERLVFRVTSESVMVVGDTLTMEQEAYILQNNGFLL